MRIFARLSAEGGQQSLVSGQFSPSRFPHRRPGLPGTAEIANDTPVAYHSRRAIVSAGLERRFSPLLTGGVALQVTKANVTQLANVNSITAAQTHPALFARGCSGLPELDETEIC